MTEIEPARASELPCIPPPEWEFHTWFPLPGGGGDMTPGQHQRGAQVRRRVTYGDWEPVRPDHWADEPPGTAAAAVSAVVPPADRAADELAKHVTRAIFGLKSPPPPGSQHYRSGWDDGLEAAMDAARDAVLSVLPATTNQAAAARLDRVREWVTSDVVTAQTEFGNGYRASQRDIRDLIKGRFDNDAANELRRVAGETQQPETPRQWCKCRSCWGWFVEEHPGEDLDELGKDLGWWSGLPEHRDAPTPAVVVQPAEPADTQQAERGEEADRG